MRTLGFDAHHLAAPEGNRTYTRNLLRTLLAHPQLLPGVELIPYLPPRWPRTLPRARTLPPTHAARALLLPLIQRRDRIDLWHTSWTAPPLAPAPVALTLHDALFLTHPREFPLALRTRLRALLPRSLARAHVVLASSRATLDALQRAFPHATHLTHVPLGIDQHTFHPHPLPTDAHARARCGLPPDTPYVLGVGRYDPRKRWPVWFAAMASLPNAHTVFAGPHRAHRATILRDARRAGLPPARLHLVDTPDDPTLAALYRGAHAHAFPSVAEGVGLPVLEALACATPTVTTTHPALQEAGLGLATHVPPDDPHALRHALAHTLQDPTLRPHLTHAAPPLLRPHTLLAAAQAFAHALRATPALSGSRT